MEGKGSQSLFLGVCTQPAVNWLVTDSPRGRLADHGREELASRTGEGEGRSVRPGNWQRALPSFRPQLWGKQKSNPIGCAHPYSQKVLPGWRCPPHSLPNLHPGHARPPISGLFCLSRRPACHSQSRANVFWVSLSSAFNLRDLHGSVAFIEFFAEMCKSALETDRAHPPPFPARVVRETQK